MSNYVIAIPTYNREHEVVYKTFYIQLQNKKHDIFIIYFILLSFYHFKILLYIKMSWFNSFVILIFIVKILYILLTLYYILFKIRDEENSNKAKKVFFFKGRLEFLFKFFMAALLIYLFNPYFNNFKLIDGEVKLLLYLFGFVLVLTADWSVIVKESVVFKKIQYIFGLQPLSST